LSDDQPREESKLRDQFLLLLDRLSSKREIRLLVYGSSLAFFFLLVLLPPLTGVLLRLEQATEIFSNAELAARAQSAIVWSFAIATLVSMLDLGAALPMAWLIARRRGAWRDSLDTLVDIPFIIPTVALGFSSLLFWGQAGGMLGSRSVFQPGLTLVLLLHFAFSYPVVVRVLVGEFQTYQRTYEVVARTLGASPFTAVRTVTLPILKPGLVAAFLLAFARSLSETGATVMVAGAFENGPVFIKNAKDAGFQGPLVFVSTVLILSSVLVFALISIVGRRFKLPLRRVWPSLETRLSSPSSVASRDAVTLIVFLLFVVAPSLFIVLPGVQAIFDGTLGMALNRTGPWSQYWNSIALSYTIGLAATLLNVLAGLPLALLIARVRVGGSITAAIDALVNVPIIIPSIALGVSLSFFWGSFGSLPEFWVLILSHTTITYTYFVRAVAAAVQGMPTELEDAARTLGARPLTVFRRITAPIIKYSLLAGAIMVFTRAIDETGAAVAVSRELKTAPVLLVDWVRGTVAVTASERALGIGFLVITSFATLLVLRLIARRV